MLHGNILVIFGMENMKHDSNFHVLESCVHLQKWAFVLLGPSFAAIISSDLQFLIEKLFLHINLKYQVFVVIR